LKLSLVSWWLEFSQNQLSKSKYYFTSNFLKVNKLFVKKSKKLKKCEISKNQKEGTSCASDYFVLKWKSCFGERNHSSKFSLKTYFSELPKT